MQDEPGIRVGATKREDSVSDKTVAETGLSR